mmetsp:Transcript_63217/g.199987  ORF Transcript_63217/g.199987 Transcript_63217/m.199987 type:complete len:175 (-) Transcript_63217:42-566(-)
MPPKKKGGKGKKVNDNPAAFEAEEKLKRAEAEILALQRLLDHHREESHQSRLSEKEWRERVDAFQVAMEQQRENTLDITSDMSRQYKAMQEQLIKRNDQLEKDCKHLTAEVKQKDEEIGELRGELDMSKKDMEELKKDNQEKIEALTNDFEKMLSETLDKMQERLRDVEGEGGR